MCSLGGRGSGKLPIGISCVRAAKGVESTPDPLGREIIERRGAKGPRQKTSSYYRPQRASALASRLPRESQRFLLARGLSGASWAVHDGGHVTQDRTVARMVLLGAVRVASRSVSLSESI